jgi:hypothetical protein
LRHRMPRKSRRRHRSSRASEHGATPSFLKQGVRRSGCLRGLGFFCTDQPRGFRLVCGVWSLG